MHCPPTLRYVEGVAEHFPMAMADDQDVLERNVLQLWKREHVALLALFGVYPSSRLKQKIHVLTDDDLNLLNSVYKIYAKADIKREEKSEIHVVFASNRESGIHRFRPLPSATTSAATGATEHLERRFANDGIAYTKTEFITHYGLMPGEKRWNAARKQDDWLSTEIARILRETKTYGGAAEHMGEASLRGTHSKQSEHVQRRVADDGITGEKRWDEAVDQAELRTSDTFKMATTTREKTGGAAEHIRKPCLRRPPRWPESQQ